MQKQLFSAKRLIITIIIALLASSSTGGVTWYFMDQTQKIQKDQIKSMEDQLVIFLGKNKELSRDNKNSNLRELDENWNIYTNSKLGFSVKVPKLNLSSYGNCEFVESDNDNSYRPKDSLVSVNIFEDGSNVYIADGYYYKLTGERKESSDFGGHISYFSGCEKTNITLEMLKNRDNKDYYFNKGWDINVIDVLNKEDLEKNIKEHYGSSCGIKVSDESIDEGNKVFEVSIIRDGKDLESSKCFVNYMYKIFYNPDRNKAIYWDLGQAPTFRVTDAKHLDQDMVKSFKFLNN